MGYQSTIYLQGDYIHDILFRRSIQKVKNSWFSWRISVEIKALEILMLVNPTNETHPVLGQDEPLLDRKQQRTHLVSCTASATDGHHPISKYGRQKREHCHRVKLPLFQHKFCTCIRRASFLLPPRTHPLNWANPINGYLLQTIPATIKICIWYFGQILPRSVN